MEQFPRVDRLKNPRDIPDAEQVDAVLSPVSQEEMDAELRLMQEATASENKAEKDMLKSDSKPLPETEMEVGKVELAEEDRIRIDALREQLNAHTESQTQVTPQEQMKPEPPEPPPERVGGGEDDELEPIIMRQAHATEHETCSACGGSGRFFFGMFRCVKCGGKGKTLTIGPNDWTSKIIGYKHKEK